MSSSTTSASTTSSTISSLTSTLNSMNLKENPASLTVVTALFFSPASCRSLTLCFAQHKLVPQKAILSTAPKLQKAQPIKLPTLAPPAPTSALPAALPHAASVSAALPASSVPSALKLAAPNASLCGPKITKISNFFLTSFFFHFFFAGACRQCRPWPSRRLRAAR